MHIAKETCYNLDRCKCQGRNCIGLSEEISSDDSDSETGMQMVIEGSPLETDPLEEDFPPSTDDNDQRRGDTEV